MHSDTTPNGLSNRLPTALRWLCLGCGIGLLALLVTARNLTPDPSGRGTHQQLGLLPCTAIILWNKPCPTCGMTTSWAFATQGSILEAARANLGGLMFAIIALGYLPASCYFFLVGKSTPGHWFSRALTGILIVALCVTVVQWIARLL